MKQQKMTVWELIGRTTYWITWPGIWLVVRLSPPRTRVAITHKGKVLLVKDWLGSGEWSLPGGGLHRKESAPEGAAREVQEELSLVIDPKQLNKVGTFRLRTNGIAVNFEGFHVELSDLPHVVLQRIELLDYTWAGSHELGSLRLSTTARAVLSELDSQAGITL